MTRWTIEQLKQAGYNVSSAIIKPKNKYNNKVTHIGNLRFDSKKEYEYYLYNFSRYPLPYGTCIRMGRETENIQEKQAG